MKVSQPPSKSQRDSNQPPSQDSWFPNPRNANLAHEMNRTSVEAVAKEEFETLNPPEVIRMSSTPNELPRNNSTHSVGFSLDMLHHIHEMQNNNIEKIFEHNKEDIQMLVRETLQ